MRDGGGHTSGAASEGTLGQTHRASTSEDEENLWPSDGGWERAPYPEGGIEEAGARHVRSSEMEKDGKRLVRSAEGGMVKKEVGERWRMEIEPASLLGLGRRRPWQQTAFFGKPRRF